MVLFTSEELDNNKLMFLHYLDFYKKLNEIDKEEKPSEEVMENPILCDEWVRVYMIRLERKQKEAISYDKSGSRVEHEQINF